MSQGEEEEEGEQGDETPTSCWRHTLSITVGFIFMSGDGVPMFTLLAPLPLKSLIGDVHSVRGYADILLLLLWCGHQTPGY